MSARSWIRVAEYGFTLIGLAAVAYFAVVWIESRRYQAREARRFAEELRLRHVAVAPHVVPQFVIPRDGALLGRIQIPRIGVSVMIVQGVGDDELKHAVGHIPGTALPGGDGNVGIAGHRDTFFRPLREIHRNDAIILSTVQGTYRYHVVSTKVVDPDDVKVLYPDGRDTLTLITCYPFYYVGSAPKRFIVHAERSLDVGALD
jgi:sortase A